MNSNKIYWQIQTMIDQLIHLKVDVQANIAEEILQYPADLSKINDLTQRITLINSSIDTLIQLTKETI